jgi:hypothetical protein
MDISPHHNLDDISSASHIWGSLSIRKGFGHNLPNLTCIRPGSMPNADRLSASRDTTKFLDLKWSFPS